MIYQIKSIRVLFFLMIASFAINAQSIDEIIDHYDNPTSYEITGLSSIAADNSGNAYVSCSSSDNVLKISEAGVITEIISRLGDLAGNNLDIGEGLSTDAAGNVYVAGRGSNNVFKIEPNGTITEIIDETGDGNGNTLSRPQATAVSAAGNVYVACNESDNVFKIEPDGTITEIIDATGDGVNVLSGPGFITVSASENVYVSSGGNVVFKITPNGVISTVIDGTGAGAQDPLSSPSGVVTDSQENLYVVSLGTHRVFKITPTGNITVLINSTGDGNGNYCEYPESIAVDNADNIYFTGWISENAFKISPAGEITEIIDETGDGNGNTLPNPRNIATNSAGQIFVSSHFNAFKIDLTVLPVELKLFKGEVTNHVNILYWETFSEQNNRGFEIQCLIEGNWEKIGFVEGIGDSFSEKKYSFQDRNRKYGQTYYRLKQIDFNGNFTYSDVISLKNDISFILSVYPNPTIGKLEIQTKEEGVIKIFDSNNVLLRQQNIKGTEYIDISDFPVGIYILSFCTVREIFTKRIVKN